MKTDRPELADWAEAVHLMGKFDRGRVHLDDLLEEALLGRARWLVMETFRQRLVVDALILPRVKHPPRPVAMNLLRLAVTECLNRREESWPKVVHHTVEVARLLKLSKPEGGFLNAVLRAVLRAGPAERAAVEQTHPGWMVARWQEQFGQADTQRLLEWNQSRPRLYVSAPEQPAYAEASDWPGFYRLPPARFEEARADLAAGRVYVQDPFARIPVDLLDVRPGETVLDLCAAPGGKSRLIAGKLAGDGLLIMVDQPGRRLERLEANAAAFAWEGAEVVASRVESLTEGTLKPSLAMGGADAVLIDVPCSNTGVLQKRPDVKLRLVEGDIQQQALEQGRLLAQAAKWVRPGGRLVYSTCSLEAEENEGVVDAFCQAHPEWQRGAAVRSLPWACGHDGGGAFLLTKALAE